MLLVCTDGTWRAADLTDARHPGDEQLAKEFIFHRHLSEEVIDFIVLAICSVPPLPDHVSINKAGLCKENRVGRERCKINSPCTPFTVIVFLLLRLLCI